MQFDWTRILKGQEAETKAPPEQEPRRWKSQRQRDAPPASPGAAGSSAPAPIVAPEPVEGVPDREPSEAESELPVALTHGESEAPALTRLGPEALLRLRARHAEVLARISERITEPGRQEELKAEAERLNPDTWVTDGEVSAGLEQYETVFESLRGVVGRRRRRRKRRSGPNQPTSSETGSSTSSGQGPAWEPAGEAAAGPADTGEPGESDADND